MNKAFIFTMDAILALIPIFIVLATVSQLSSEEGLFLQTHVLGSERIAHDTLETMGITKKIESLNKTELNETLNSLIPAYFNYSYEVEYNGSILFNITGGDLSGAGDIMAAKRLALVKIIEISGDPLIDIGRGVIGAEPYCSGPGRGWGKPPIYEASFYVSLDDLETYDYWLVGIRDDSSGEAAYKIYPSQQTCPDLQADIDEFTEVFTVTELIAKVIINGELTEGTTNYLYIRITGDPGVFMDFYVIKAPQDTAQDAITPERAKLKDIVLVTLKVCAG